MFGSRAIVLRGKTIAQKVNDTHSFYQTLAICRTLHCFSHHIVCARVRAHTSVCIRIINLLCNCVNTKINFSLYFAIFCCQNCRFICINRTISIHIRVFVGFLLCIFMHYFCIIIQFLPLLCALYHLIYILYNIARTCAPLCALPHDARTRE